ncbi:SGNH hydrolase domain-containing protein [Agrococcus sp. ARC_14]|uniref:SGNH hydrolase domain-containing protein n=1 Tax=Agrococcus sp. ARC_14 TaxID=2919927 RepID=UPI001F0545AE|nr:SGNH hydrolase domain-containing protein [Agrococcus sp. ARC_14]MCH1884115.1 hypothetical protein [Agrococcus sp. ARC_14]
MRGVPGRALTLIVSLGMAISVLSPDAAALATPSPTPPPAPSQSSEPTPTPSPSAPPVVTPTPTPTPTPTEPIPAPTATPAPSPASSPAAVAPMAQLPTGDQPAAQEPKVHASLWMTTDTTWVRFGRSVTVTGRLWAGEVGVAGAPVRIVGLSARTGRWVVLATVTTRADGRFTHVFTPLEGYRIKAEVLDSPRVAAAASRSRTITVKPGISGVAPRGSSHASIGGEYVVTGGVYAQLAGRRIKLEGLTSSGWTTIAQSSVTSTGAFALRHTVRDAAVTHTRVILPSSGTGLLVAAGPTVSLRTWSTPGALAAANLQCFGVDAILDAACPTTGGAGVIAPTTDASRLFAQTGGAFASACWKSSTTVLVPVCTRGSTRADALRVAFIGDSHAAGYAATMESEFVYWNWSVDTYLGRSCRWEYVPEGHGCEPRYRQLAAAAVSGEYDLVVYTGLRFPYADRPAEAAEVRDRYVRAWQPVVDAGIPLIVMSDLPHIGIGTIDCVTESSGASPFGCSVPQSYAHRGWDPVLEAAALVPEVRVVDVTRYLCVDGTCPLVIGGAIVYRDAHHLTGTYLTSISSKIMWELRRASR